MELSVQLADEYPVREDAQQGIAGHCLYKAVCNGRITGSMILRHTPGPAYQYARWQEDLPDENVLVVYTFVVHPDYQKMGTGQALLRFAAGHCRRAGIWSLRLDVYENNLYEKLII